MKDDKKKLIILGALVAVLAGVGAFTFLSGGSTPTPPPVAATADTKTDDTQKTTVVDENGKPVNEEVATSSVKNPLYAAELPQRDPFQVSGFGAQEFQPRVPQPIPQPRPTQRRPSGRRSSGGGDFSIPPYSPLSGSLPVAGGGSVTVPPTGPDPSTFGYTVSGTMTGGKRPVAVFSDSSGNQRLVPGGGSLDGDSIVIAVEKGAVTIEHRGKKQRLSLGGNPK
jgi:hypothetical protein